MKRIVHIWTICMMVLLLQALLFFMGALWMGSLDVSGPPPKPPIYEKWDCIVMGRAHKSFSCQW
jgi:hypothetical protein